MQNIVSYKHQDSIETILTDTVKEAGRSPPPFPFIFFKPVPSVIGHNEDVIIPKICQDDQADYEGELVCLYPLSSKMLLASLV
jgi:hypothetical protein